MHRSIWRWFDIIFRTNEKSFACKSPTKLVTYYNSQLQFINLVSTYLSLNRINKVCLHFPAQWSCRIKIYSLCVKSIDWNASGALDANVGYKYYKLFVFIVFGRWWSRLRHVYCSCKAACACISSLPDRVYHVNPDQRNTIAFWPQEYWSIVRDVTSNR